MVHVTSLPSIAIAPRTKGYVRITVEGLAPRHRRIVVGLLHTIGVGVGDHEGITGDLIRDLTRQVLVRRRGGSGCGGVGFVSSVDVAVDVAVADVPAVESSPSSPDNATAAKTPPRMSTSTATTATMIRTVFLFPPSPGG